MSYLLEDTADLNLEKLMNDVDTGGLYEARNHLHDLSAVEIALLIKSLPIDYRYKIWKVVSNEMMGSILVHLQGEVRTGLIEHSSAKDLLAAVDYLDIRDSANLIDDFPADLRERILKNQADNSIEVALSYDAKTASGIMSFDALTIRKDVTVDAVLGYLRGQNKMPVNIDSLVVVDKDDNYQGMIAVSTVLTHEAHALVSDLMDAQFESITLDMPISNVALIFEKKDILSAAVVDENNKVIGRISLGDVLALVKEEADHAVLSGAGLDEEHDLFAPILVSAKRRAVWLGVNLFTAFLASWVIGLFEATIDEIVALAVLMPVVASMGGIAGSQTLTLVIRGLALHQISASNSMSFLFKELAIGAVNGVVWSFVVAGIAGVWFSDMMLGTMLGGAMIINLSCASIAGVLIPLFLQKRGIDPALAGGVLLTTVTDVIGFMSFLGLATIFLVN